MIIFCSVLFILRWTTCKYVSQGNSLSWPVWQHPLVTNILYLGICWIKKGFFWAHTLQRVCNVPLSWNVKKIPLICCLFSSGIEEYTRLLPKVLILQICPNSVHHFVTQYYFSFLIISQGMQYFPDFFKNTYMYCITHQNTHFFYIRSTILKSRLWSRIHGLNFDCQTFNLLNTIN